MICHTCDQLSSEASMHSLATALVKILTSSPNVTLTSYGKRNIVLLVNQVFIIARHYKPREVDLSPVITYHSHVYYMPCSDREVSGMEMD